MYIYKLSTKYTYKHYKELASSQVSTTKNQDHHHESSNDDDDK